MRKKLKIALLSFLLIPCMFILTACEKSIDMSEYNNRLGDSAKDFYSNYEEMDMTIVNKDTTTKTWKQELKVKTEAGAETTSDVECSFKSVVERVQTIAHNKLDEGHALQVVTEQTTTEKGSKLNADETALEEYTKVTTVLTTDTLVLEESPVLYHKVEIKVDGELDADESIMGTYTFLDSGYSNDEILEVLDNVNAEIFEDVFYMSNYKTYAIIIGGDIEYYKDGKDAFGLKLSASLVGVDNKNTNTGNLCIENSFEDYKPSKFVSNMCVNTTAEGHGIYEIFDINETTESSVEVKYSCGEITAPAGFDNAIVLPNMPTININSVKGGVNL